MNSKEHVDIYHTWTYSDQSAESQRWKAIVTREREAYHFLVYRAWNQIDFPAELRGLEGANSSHLVKLVSDNSTHRKTILQR